MFVTLEELKESLRIETDDDDELLTTILDSATHTVKDILRVVELQDSGVSVAKMGVLYAATYMYEHREEADFNEMNLTLRALLFGERSSEF